MSITHFEAISLPVNTQSWSLNFGKCPRAKKVYGAGCHNLLSLISDKEVPMNNQRLVCHQPPTSCYNFSDTASPRSSNSSLLSIIIAFLPSLFPEQTTPIQKEAQGLSIRMHCEQYFIY